MADILDLIDHAIGDYGLSDDAMRWTPTASRPTIDPEAAQLAVAAFGRALQPVVAQFKVMMTGLGQALVGWCEQAKPMFAALQRFQVEVDGAKRARLRRMHSAYHAKRRA